MNYDELMSTQCDRLRELSYIHQLLTACKGPRVVGTLDPDGMRATGMVHDCSRDGCQQFRADVRVVHHAVDAGRDGCHDFGINV